jgi:hypothetical protein
MDTPVLTDKGQFPTDAVVTSHLGKSKALWVAFFDHLHAVHADVLEEWRYYADGKSWLLKLTRKSKTVCWISVVEGAFRITFYFTDKAAPAIAASAIAAALKEQFTTGQAYGKVRGLTIVPKRARDIDDAKALIALKLTLK